MRKEVLVTQDIVKYQKAREKLAQNGIRSTSRISDLANPSSGFWSLFGMSRRVSTGMAFENRNIQKTYYIYVSKEDYEYAQYLVRSL